MVALFSEAYFEPARWTIQEWAAALMLAKEDPARFVPVRIEDVVVPEILGPILAPALFGLSAGEACAELLRAVQGRDGGDAPDSYLAPLAAAVRVSLDRLTLEDPAAGPRRSPHPSDRQPAC